MLAVLYVQLFEYDSWCLPVFPIVLGRVQGGAAGPGPRSAHSIVGFVVGPLFVVSMDFHIFSYGFSLIYRRFFVNSKDFI